MLPRMLRTYELPFGVQNVEVEVVIDDIEEFSISKEILPAPFPLPKSPVQGFVAPPKKDKTIYSNDALFPSS